MSTEAPVAAAPESAPEAVTKRTRRGPRKDLFAALVPVENKPTVKLTESPEIGEGEGQFNPAKMRKLTSGNFADEVPYCKYMADSLRYEARGWSSKAEELAKLGSVKERKAVAAAQKLAEQLVEMQAALAAQGIKMELDKNGKLTPVVG